MFSSLLFIKFFFIFQMVAVKMVIQMVRMGRRPVPIYTGFYLFFRLILNNSEQNGFTNNSLFI